MLLLIVCNFQSENNREKTTESSYEAKNANKVSRRVSIHFNGKPLTEEETNNETFPPIPPTLQPQNNDNLNSNLTDISMDENESILLTPSLACRRHSRRASINRKYSDDSLGAFLYPPSPFMIKRNGKKSFLPRRHSDSLLPRSDQSQYYNECNMSTKQNHRHRYHNHHHNHGIKQYIIDKID